MNDRSERTSRPIPTEMSVFSSRVAGIGPVPSPRGPFVREMERPRTESYGELYRRASMRLRRF